MRRHLLVALVALSLVSCFAAPQNNAAVEKAEKTSVAVVADKVKGQVGALVDSYQNDQMIRTCANGVCKLMMAGAVKGLDYSTINAVFPVRGDAALTKALTPSVSTVMESMKGLDQQQSRLEKLKADMAALNAMFDKGSQASDLRSAQYAATMTKGVVLPAAPLVNSFAAALPPSKGSYAAAYPSGKGAYAAPLKGSSAATMQLEASMCPMCMYELGKTQKLYAETNGQLQTANTLNAMLMREKDECERQKAMAEMGKMQAEQQAAFNAKYAAEQKSRADRLELQLAQANSEKEALKQQKAVLEATLRVTEEDLAQEKQTTAALTEALKSCNEDKAQLQEQKTALIQELAETQDMLRQTQRALEKEQFDHARTQRELEATKDERDAIEAARRQLEEANHELEDELAETKNQLEAMTAERDQLQVTLDATSASLAKCNEARMQCKAELEQEKIITAMLNSQLADAMALLTAEKKAREELTNLLMQVKATAEILEQEVQKLQLENALLRQHLMKLKSEQEVALAMAAGCPPTYEKFGGSCYKYVREKTQWKMAQEQCMKDGGNLVSIETRNEQAYLVDYLKRYGAEKDTTYALTGGIKHMGHWKWWASTEKYIGETGPEYWFNELTKRKPNYDCQAMYLRDPMQYGKWVGHPCHSATTYTCEYQIAPAGTVPNNAAESMAMYEMYQDAPPYLNEAGSSKGSMAFAPPSKGAMAFAPLSKGAALAPASKGVPLAFAQYSKGAMNMAPYFPSKGARFM